MERSTRQKKLIYKVLEECHSHPTLQELAKLVQKEDASIGQATVYRTINKLTDSGEIEKLVSVGHNIRYDVAKNHYHFQCIRCGMIEDIFYTKNEKEELEKLFANRKINTFDLVGYGICSNCLEDNH